MEGIQPPSQNHLSGEARKHHSLFFEDGTLLLQVENTIFKVHRSILSRYSTVIRDLIDESNGISHDNNTEEICLILNGDSLIGWELLLGLQYNGPRITSDGFIGEDLLSILTITHKYDMQEIQRDVIKELEKNSTYGGLIDLIVASKIVNSDEIYRDAIRRLIALKESLKLEQAKRIGAEATFSIMQAEMKRLRTST
ncbi:hypothetical protein CPB86DRAFT_878583 [Serendipita vermifera]|nr:hypothetical protein CPB86DRAFT_878583 [Serendipita vermifera]